ncbi:glycosyl hydrolase family 28 protein (plasmid) [Burkholderia cenocepacia]|uniref:Glycoside hydrolase n=3 Tax=Burkholderia TaxID=32008 RepID=A0AAX2RIH8_BURCE|nr:MULTISPECIES: glycosyl hydrolase family 28 protein [Burkholderia]MEB2507775.1 glycosyl hydrolase family 28 protein [Burkholderia anthinoferrum]MEB2535773.1 glycosyl hydrolase family 28 protein [Burkholderia anthinoferrum]MEB2565508.1 glycosyl hydrolase family 28 protein [Burkholderia anthinoferrum]MEB2583743.1 glycosyl hydrolase family 28 protein [Burkholderia anthinoferrum]ABK13648.1 glycoside hydrolase, family 28 [Burkholderia cenocepacia HI2424]
MKGKSSTRLVLMLSALAALAVQASAQAATCTPQWSSSASTNTTNLQNAIQQCAASGTSSSPGLVDLASNNGISTAVITSVNLASNIVLKLEKGFTLKGSPAQPSSGAMLTGSNLSNLTITGTGAIDGDGQDYWPAAVGQNNTARPKLIAITGSNLQIGSNFTDAGKSQSIVAFPSSSNATGSALIIRNSPKEQLVIESGSKNVTIDGVWIYANPNRNASGDDLAPNTDAIDIIGTQTATIKNCLLDTGDDDIAIKSNAGGAATSSVNVSHCVVGGGHGISIGGQEAAGTTLAKPGVSQVTVDTMQFSGTDYGYRIKTDQTAKDSGATTGVTYRNTCMRNVQQPFLFTYAYASGTGGALPIIANVTIDNVIATATKQQGAIIGLSNSLMGVPKSGDTGISITNSQISGGKAFSVTDGELQLGSHSSATTSTGSNGQVVGIPDTGATLSCPSSITIPAQI